MSQGFLLPPIDPTNAPFWEGARQGELRVPRCAGCRHYVFPPRPMCPHCRGTELPWVPVSGRGRIWSFVVPHPPLLPEFAELAPYNVIVVTLDEDPALRMLGNLVNAPGDPIDSVDPASIEIGAAVRVVFEPVSDAVHLPRWVRVRGGRGRSLT